MNSSRVALVSSVALVAACSPPPPADGGDAQTDVMACVDSAVTLDAGGTCPVLGRNESACGTDLVAGYGRDGTFENYRAFAPADVVWIAPGAQGLQHIVVALRGRGFDPTNPLVSLRFVIAATCHQVGFVRFRLPFSEDLNDHSLFELQAQRVVLLDDTNPLDYCTAMDQDVVLIADIDDLRGHRAHREYALHVGGIDPETRPDLRQAWIDACSIDGGTRDASAESGLDAMTDGSSE